MKVSQETLQRDFTCLYGLSEMMVSLLTMFFEHLYTSLHILIFTPPSSNSSDSQQRSHPDETNRTTSSAKKQRPPHWMLSSSSCQPKPHPWKLEVSPELTGKELDLYSWCSHRSVWWFYTNICFYVLESVKKELWKEILLSKSRRT